MRDELVELLRGGKAHLTTKDALEELEPELRHLPPAPGVPSVFELLEHMRIAQEDILRFSKDPDWHSPEWPLGYWPKKEEPLTRDRWESALSGFYRDLEEVIAMAADGNSELTDSIPHGEGQTYLREVLLTADHNAYHLGQIVQTIKTLRKNR